MTRHRITPLIPGNAGLLHAVDAHDPIAVHADFPEPAQSFPFRLSAIGAPEQQQNAAASRAQIIQAKIRKQAICNIITVVHTLPQGNEEQNQVNAVQSLGGFQALQELVLFEQITDIAEAHHRQPLGQTVVVNIKDIQPPGSGHATHHQSDTEAFIPDFQD